MNIVCGVKTFCIPANQPQPTINNALLSNTCQNLSFVIGLLWGLSNFLIGNTRFLTFNLITTTLHDVTNKKRYKQRILVYLS